jgi:hypothetical protein
MFPSFGARDAARGATRVLPGRAPDCSHAGVGSRASRRDTDPTANGQYTQTAVPNGMMFAAQTKLIASFVIRTQPCDAG